MRAARLACLVLVASGCGEDAVSPPAATQPAALMKTLTDLAAFGNKHVGTPAAVMAGEYVRDRMIAAGLTGVHGESFQFPRHNVTASSFTLSVDGAPSSPGHDVFYGSGPGRAEGEVVFVGTAIDSELTGRDLTGKIAMVDRATFFHRSSQYRNVIAKGAIAMLYLSKAPDNLRQVGSVNFKWEPMGAIPTISIGADDGTAIKAALTAGKAVRATIDVQADTVRSLGTNWIGRIEGSSGASGQIVIGAHYDTWFAGSTDNGGGVAALLALAERRKGQPKPNYTLIFVAYDGEEVALYGGYDYLRKHRIITADPILAVINFEVPASVSAGAFGLARSNVKVLDDALSGQSLDDLYTLYVDLELVAQIFGGIIPTDIQGIYRSGVPTVSTAVDPPYYHTTQDTPDKVDTVFLADATDRFDDAISYLQTQPLSAFAERDQKLWNAAVTPRPRAPGQPLQVEVKITDAKGVAQMMVPVNASLLVDDFFEAGDLTGMTDAGGSFVFEFSAAQADRGADFRFVHITAGPDWALVEQVAKLP